MKLINIHLSIGHLGESRHMLGGLDVRRRRHREGGRRVRPRARRLVLAGLDGVVRRRLPGEGRGRLFAISS